MVNFFIGLFIGAFVGITFMALFNASSRYDECNKNSDNNKND
ncbi:MAG: DUF3789 domain-containing protein [Acutalibacteraceae bacterium]|nr:DUF3789 domain-containing protein [Acutalibacteraceae bacterium]